MNRVQILGISFFNGKSDQVFDYLKKEGGLLTVPAAPGLATIDTDRLYYKALLESDLVIPDSGYMVLLWNILSKTQVHKLSGLDFINRFLYRLNEVEHNSLFLVNPSDAEGLLNQQYIQDKGVTVPNNYLYTAPYYNQNVTDAALLQRIEATKPQWILINIGGGIQEKLGLYLRDHLSYKPAIICTGAAIAFKTGAQVKVPRWVDKMYLGWLSRCISKPKVYIPRYWNSFSLALLLWKYRDKPVPLQS